MLREGGQVACHDVMTIDFSLIGMAIQRRVRRGIKVLCFFTMLAMAFLGCSRAMPELGPDKFTSTAPGKAYVVPKEKKQEALRNTL